ncbi:hypothetical protein [Pantoea vagans]|uniref:hypothetical protein n=1 Tax=Pantoea vagans TaxID=470934 RepID=UPI003018759B
MAILEESKKMKVVVILKGRAPESFVATAKPQLFDGWLRVNADTASHYFAEGQVESYRVKNITDSAALDSEPSNGQYHGINPELASYKAARLTEAAAETGQTLQLFKHLSVLLPIMHSAERNG